MQLAVFHSAAIDGYVGGVVKQHLLEVPHALVDKKDAAARGHGVRGGLDGCEVAAAGRWTTVEQHSGATVRSAARMLAASAGCSCE